MSTQGGQFTGAAELVGGDATSKMDVRWDRAFPYGATHAVRARRTRGVALALGLVCLQALPPLASAEAMTRAAPVNAPAVPGDEYWAANFGSQGMNSGVLVLAFGSDGSLYAGGLFTTAGGVAANSIARWDDAQWHPLGSGMGGGGGVSALAFGTDGSLYAGGSFTTAGGVAANYIARWDGAQWHPLGSGMNNYVFALEFGPYGPLYAGGWFRTAGATAANSIARWDGFQWYPLGNGIVGEVEPTVFALAFGAESLLFAGGYFITAGDKVSSHIAQQNGEAVRRCDFNDGGVVDVGDIMIVAARWNQPAGPPHDLDGDGMITVVDIQRVARWWGWPVPYSLASPGG